MSDTNYIVVQMWLVAAFVVAADGEWTLFYVALFPVATHAYSWWRSEP